MGRKSCIIHANCQGEPLIERLQCSATFSREFEVCLFTNYIREEIPAGVLESCDLFLYQFLGPEWGELSSEFLLSRLADNIPHLCIPNMFFMGYWPLWSGEPGFNYRDTHLDTLLGRDLNRDEVLLLHMRLSPVVNFDLDELLNTSIERERERESHTPVKYLDTILDSWRNERLFNTVNHPGAQLMNHAAKGVLEQLGMETTDLERMKLLGDPFPEFQQPIHPKVAEHFKLGFGMHETEYEVYGGRMNYTTYAAAYADCRLRGESDFIGYLQAVHA